MKNSTSDNSLIHPLVKKILFTNAEIVEEIKKLAKKINKKYEKKNKTIVLLGVLKGCLPFMMELIKYLNFDIIIDFMVVSSYFGGIKKSSQGPKLVLDVDTVLENKHIIIIEDIVETGDTIREICTHLASKKPASIKIASLIFKKNPQFLNLDIIPDWYAFDAPIEFLVGFGLDYQEKLRNLDYVGILKT